MMKSRQIRMVLTVVLAVLVVVPLTTQVVEAKRFTKVNVANYIFNKSGRLKVKDKLLVTKSAVFNTAVNVKGQLKNTDSGEALKVDDDLYVTGDTTIDGTLTGTVWDVKGQLKNTDSGEALKVDDDLYVTGDTTIDGAITSAVWNGDAIDISSYSNLAAGTGVTLSGDTLNVDDDYVKNTGDTVNGDLTVTGDVATTGTHTASGILNSKTGNILTGLSITDADGCDTPNLVTFDVAADLSDVRIGDIFTDEDSARFEITGINDAGDSLSIIGTCTFNGSDDATVSRPSLLADGDVGIGVDVPLTALDVAGALRLSTPNINAFEFGNAYNIYYSESAVFQLKTTGNSRIFEVTDDTDFFFDNVDVYPDNDNAQSLGLTTNRWSEVHATEGDFSTIVMPETSSKGTCDATTKGTMTYEVIASVGTFYGCTQTGASSYAWAAFH